MTNEQNLLKATVARLEAELRLEQARSESWETATKRRDAVISLQGREHARVRQLAKEMTSASNGGIARRGRQLLTILAAENRDVDL